MSEEQEKQELETPEPELDAEPKEREEPEGEDREPEGGSREQEAELKRYRELWEGVKGLLTGEVPEGEARVNAFRRVLGEAGYSPQQIEEYLEMVEGQRAGGGEEGEKEEEVKGRGSEEWERESRELRNQVKKTRHSQLRRELRESVEAGMAGREIRGMVEAVREIKGEKAAKEFEGFVREDLERMTLERVQGRYDQRGGAFEDEWIGEEARGAAKELEKKYRSGIADPGKIGRVAETVTGDWLKGKKPVEAPEFKPGMDRGDLAKQVNEFTEDALLRLVSDAESGGKTRV
jgi:hypothetical protein